MKRMMQGMIVALGALHGMAHAGTVVAPPGLGVAAGNGSFSTSPFNATDSSTRIQQLFSSTMFSSLSGPVQITGIAFRPKTAGAGFTFPHVQVDLSTIAATSLSSTFASNVGANDTVDFNGVLTLPAVASAPVPGSVGQFQVSIPFTTPFVYNPAAGNLVVDIRVFTVSGGTYQIDAQGQATGTLVFSEQSANTADVNSLTGVVQNGVAVTEFTFAALSAVPEPGTMGLFGAALFALRLLRRRGV